MCKSEQSGAPRDAAIEWKVDSFPTELTLYYHNGKTTISERSLNFIIEPEKQLGLEPLEASMVVSQGRNWASVPFAFPRAGKYVVSAYRADRSVMASTLISIDGPEKETRPVLAVVTTTTTTPSAVLPAGGRSRLDNMELSTVQIAPGEPEPVVRPLTEEELKTLKFDDVNIAFGTGVKDKKLVAPANVFADAQTRKGIIAQLSGTKPFGVSELVMSIWRDSGSSTTEFDEHVLDVSMDVDAKSYTMQAPITLYKKGKYKVSFFTGDFVWIGSAYLTVN